MPTLRRATMRDLDTLVAHRRRMWEDMRTHPAAAVAASDAPYRRWARARLASGRLVGWVVEAKGAPVASGVVWVQPVQPRPGWPHGTQPYLLSMFTEPAWRGKGLARRIVREALRWSKAGGFPHLALHASDQGMPIYASMGFERTKEMRYALARRR